MTTTQRMTTSRPYNPTTHVNPINPFNPVTGSISILVVEGERQIEIQKQIDREFFRNTPLDTYYQGGNVYSCILMDFFDWYHKIFILRAYVLTSYLKLALNLIDMLLLLHSNAPNFYKPDIQLFREGEWFLRRSQFLHPLLHLCRREELWGGLRYWPAF